MFERLHGLLTALLIGSAIATMATLPARADELEKVKERGKLIVGIKNDYPPFGWLDANGTLKGFEVDLAKAVAKQLLGSETALELVPVVASNRIELLNAGRIDVIFATLGENADRAKVIDFTTPYYMMAGIVLLAPKDTPIKAWEDLKGRRICGIQGDLYNRTLTEKFGADTLLFTGTADMFQAFQQNRCEAIAYDGPILQQKIGDPAWAAKYKIALPTFDYIPIAGGVRKGEPAFLAAIDKAILQAEAAGVLTHAENAYGMGESDYVTKQAAAAKTGLQ
jgi:polar amino acid transport system substrate-binding protein